MGQHDDMKLGAGGQLEKPLILTELDTKFRKVQHFILAQNLIPQPQI